VAYELFKLGVPATFYIVTREPPYSMYLKYAKKTISMKHKVGSHSVSYANLLRVRDDELLFEVGESRRVLKEVTGQEVVGFVYLHGFYNSKVVSIVGKFYGYGRTIYCRFMGVCNSINALNMICGLSNISPSPLLDILRGVDLD
jgi:peptidoglycan/xylan/chitin deacetylase (PgdA/CDA1 family)